MARSKRRRRFSMGSFHTRRNPRPMAGQQPGVAAAQTQPPGAQPGGTPAVQQPGGAVQGAVAQNQPEGAVVPPDPSAQYRGWYPRWWLLSAFFCYIFFGGAMLLQPVLCLGRLSASAACQFSTWTDWRQGIVVIVIWFLFLVGWVFSHILGVRYIERTQAQRTAVGSALRLISEFKIVYPPLYIYGMLAFAAIVAVWITNRFESVFFALSSITVFVVNSCYLYTRQPEDRRVYMLGYIILAIVGIALLIIVGPFQPIMFWSMVAVIVVSLVVYFWTRPSTSTTSSAVPPLTQQNAATISVAQIVLSLVRAMLRRKANPNPANANSPTS